jgi:hypothetical protein
MKILAELIGVITELTGNGGLSRVGYDPSNKPLPDFL